MRHHYSFRWKQKCYGTGDGAAAMTHASEDITGLYDVGDASFDITDLSAGRLLADHDEPLTG